MNITEIEKVFSKNPAYLNYNSKYDLSFEVADMLIRARISKGISQVKLAKIIKSKQPNIARIENGNYLPSLKTLDRIAKAFDSYLIAPKFAFLEEEDRKESITQKENKTFIHFSAKNIDKSLLEYSWVTQGSTMNISSFDMITPAR